jgi:NAD(P)H-hydrate epimerase
MIRVVSSAESALRDQITIQAGIPSRALMERAGAASASEIALRYRDRLSESVLILAGPGNNGGDAWVVARALRAAGVRVRVIEPIAAKTPDAIAERALAVATIDPTALVSGSVPESFDHGESIVIDGLLGTGGRGEPTGVIADAVRGIRRMRERGAIVVALDVPTGMDATTGAAADVSVSADLTLTFGTAKRGQLVNRDATGSIVVLDIGLTDASADRAPQLVDDAWVAAQLPRISADAHKGTRKKLAIIGGSEGMAGASVLAGRSALRSGIGMVKIVVAPASVRVIQETEPYALAAAWPSNDSALDASILKWADAVVIGPGLGRGDESRAVLERVLTNWRGPTLLDADAITLFENRAADLAALLRNRPALLTPHPLEFARIAGTKADEVLANRFEIAADLAKQLGATVLLKGVPTIITSPDGARLVSPTGTPVLATGGSGDLLSGIAGTLLAQLGDPFTAAAVAAFVHGRAAERVPTARGGAVRGVILDEIVGELRNVWEFDARPTRYPVLAELPAVSA